ncbi:zinc finger protein 774 [Pangasianodon hypophthalmus]|uniref:zinc finger protein 774 n=1 Tax=Pangasianodon hypophthalmus TaxID=310915 RepID=UPI0023077391|nr:zinc finger protein 774 [Pangasianodon hypophthalmus]
MGSLPLCSVRLLVPPLRLMSAFMWRVVQQQNLEYFDKLEEYILLITRMVPEILSERQRSVLIMGLRAKMILEMCKDELPTDLKTVRARLHTIESFSMSKSTGSEVEVLQGRLLKLVLSLLEDPVKKEHFFQEVFPREYGPEFDKALQVLVGHFLSRMEQLLPVPNFKQAAQWLDTEPTGWEELVQMNCDPTHLLPLLQSDYHGNLDRNGLPSIVEERIISSLSLASLTDDVVPIESKSDDQSVSMDSSSQTDQDVMQDSKTDVLSHVIVTSEQPVCHSETALEELESLTYNRQEEGDLNENGLNETREETTKTSQTESEDETSTDVERSEPSAVIADLGNDGGGAAEELSTGSEGNSRQMLKVIVPKHLLPAIKQITLPSVLLSRCTSTEPVPLKVVPVSDASSSLNSSVSENTRTVKRRQARAHKEQCASTGSYKCVPCKMSFKTHFQASVHQRKRHRKLIYSCPSCEKSFESMKAWTRHRTEHKEEKPQRCTDCGEECASLQALVAHSKTHNHVVSESLPTSEKAAPPPKPAPGECKFCGETFTPIELRNHLKTHPEFRPHQCDHCGRCFANLSNLLAHISNHTGEKPHVCLNCGKKFFSKSQLKSHMKSHSKERPYCCSYCGKCFHTAGNLNIHTRIHTGEKPYTCIECGKAFSSAGRLQVHRRCHTGEKPYQCDVCGRGFIVSSHRTIHMRSHTGVRPFTCEICGKTFSRRNCWSEHMYSHTDSKPFPCPICSKSFIRRSHLKRHMQSHSADQSNAV